MCLESLADYLLLPCRHLCVCGSCAVALLMTCPICCLAVKSFFRVFLPAAPAARSTPNSILEATASALGELTLTSPTQASDLGLSEVSESETSPAQPLPRAIWRPRDPHDKPKMRCAAIVRVKIVGGSATICLRPGCRPYVGAETDWGWGYGSYCERRSKGEIVISHYTPKLSAVKVQVSELVLLDGTVAAVCAVSVLFDGDDPNSDYPPPEVRPLTVGMRTEVIVDFVEGNRVCFL